jgi:hypothetical protein
MSKIKKSAVETADTKELRSIATKAGIKFIGKKNDDLRKELLAIAEDDAKPAKKAAAKKPAEKKPAGKKDAVKKDAVKKEAVKKERVLVPEKRAKEVLALGSKKAQVITLREEGYPINAIAETVGMHPTNVSRYIREAGLSTSKVTVPEERKARIKATIAAKKGEKSPAAKIAAAKKPAARQGQQESGEDPRQRQGQGEEVSRDRD